MNTMKQAVHVLSSLMTELEDDHVGLWSIVKQMRRAFPDDPPEVVRKKSLALIKWLLEMGSIEAGFPTQDGRGFAPWEINPSQVVTRIKSKWKNPEQSPKIGDIVWFTTPSSINTLGLPGHSNEKSHDVLVEKS